MACCYEIDNKLSVRLCDVVFCSIMFNVSMMIFVTVARLIEVLFPVNDQGTVKSTCFSKIDELYQKINIPQDQPIHIGVGLSQAMRLRKITMKTSDDNLRKEITTVVHKFYGLKSSINQMNHFVSNCLGSFLPEQHWDQCICRLYNKLSNIGRLFRENLGGVLFTSPTKLGGEYETFVSEIVKESNSEIFKQLWKDVVLKQMNKYGMKGIKIQDMDCIDVCLFVKSLRDQQPRRNREDSVDVDTLVFTLDINGKTLLPSKNLLKIDRILENVDKNTKFEWNGQLSMKLLSLMYEWMAKPKWKSFQGGIGSGSVTMKKVDYYFRKCGITTRDKIEDELNTFGMAHMTDIIMNAMKCREMLDNELLIAYVLDILRNNANLCDFGGSKNDKEETENLRVDVEYGQLLKQLYKSKYPWNDDNGMTASTRNVIQGLLSKAPAISSNATTLNDILAIWERKDLICFWRNKNNNNKKHAKNDGEIINKRNKKWLKLCLTNGGVINGLFDRFGSAESFTKHKAMSQYADPMSESRKNTLNQIREYFVEKIAKQIVSSKMNMSQARSFLVNKIFATMKDRNVTELKEFIAIWDEIDKTTDFRQNQHLQDRTLLSKLRYFVLQNCSLEVTTINSQSKNNDQVKDNNHKETNTRGILDENEFGNLMDRLLISTHSGTTTGQMFVEHEEMLKEWSVKDICDTMNIKYRYIHILQSMIKKRGINGKLLFKYHESQEHMMYLLFSKIDNFNNAADIGEVFLDFDLRKLRNVAMRKAIRYDYSQITVSNGDDDLDEKKDICKEIVNDVLRAVQGVIIDEQTKMITPKYETVKKILKIMKEYAIMGGKQDLLDRKIKIDIYSPHNTECKKILQTWEKELNDWRQMMDNLQSKYKYLCYFTVNEMRFICHEWVKYQNKHITKQEMNKCIWRLNGKLCIINTSFSFEQTKRLLKNSAQFGKGIAVDGDERKWFEELGKHLELCDFGGGNKLVRNKYINKSDNLQHGKPNVFYCKHSDQILNNIIKLYSSQPYLPTANNVLFCTPEMQCEQVLCFLKRSGHNGDILHCLVTPEKLKSSVCDELLDVLIDSIENSVSLFAVIINDDKSKIYSYLSTYDMSIPLMLQDLAKEQFYQQCIITDERKDDTMTGTSGQLLSFLRFSSTLPFVRVYVSDNACVGKTYEIRKFAKEKNVRLIHVPCNTYKYDEEFIVNRLCSSYDCNTNNDQKIVFHVNVSSCCGQDLNVLLFKLLILKYLSCSTRVTDGKSFAVTSNHAFFIELPCELSREFKSTKLRHVLNHFYFVGDDACIGRKKIVMDLSRFKPTEKHLFVLKYLHALKERKLEIKGKRYGDWDWKYYSKKRFTPQEIKS